MAVDYRDVYLEQETAPCRAWVVWLRRVGCRIEVWRERAECGGVARAKAESLAAFLDVPLTAAAPLPASSAPAKPG